MRRQTPPLRLEQGRAPSPTRRRRLTAVGLALPLWMSVCGCNVTYDPPSLINKLRVVAVRADPPVLSAATTTLQPLILGASADAKLCYAWSLCLFALAKDGRYACVDPELETSLGQGPTAQVSLQQAFGLLSRIKPVFDKLDINIPKEFGGGGPPSLADAGGFEVFVRFKVAERDGDACPAGDLAWLAEPCADRDRCIAGYKRLALATNPSLRHSNPVLTGVAVNGVLWPADVTPTVPCYQGDDSFGQVGPGALAMEPRWSPESREVIPAQSEDTNIEPKREGLLFSWLSTAGNWKKQRTFDDVPDNHFLPPDYEPLQAGRGEEQRVRLWVVARDGRNGTAWISRQVDVRRDAPRQGNPLCRARPSLAGCPAAK